MFSGRITYFPGLVLYFSFGCSVSSLVVTFDPLALFHLPLYWAVPLIFLPSSGRIRDRHLTDTLAQRFSTCGSRPLWAHISDTYITIYNSSEITPMK